LSYGGPAPALCASMPDKDNRSGGRRAPGSSRTTPCRADAGARTRGRGRGDAASYLAVQRPLRFGSVIPIPPNMAKPLTRSTGAPGGVGSVALLSTPPNNANTSSTT